MRRYLDRIYFDKPASYQSRIIGIILLIVGIIFLYNPTLLNIKIGATSILIGLFMIFLMTGETTTKGISDAQITLGIAAWILLMFFITGLGEANLQIFFISIFIGLLMIAEISDNFTAIHLKKRLSIFISVFLIAFIVIIITKIISMAGM